MSLHDEQRSEPRTDVQLAARVSTDGEKFRRAVVTNLSVRGAYVEGEIDLPHRSRVLVDVVLGTECVRLRARVAHPDEWPEHARRIGIGVELVARTKEAVDAIDAMLAHPPAALATGPSGELLWPLDPEAGSGDTASDAAGLSFLGAVNWEPVMAVSEEHGAIEEPGPGATLEDYRAWAQALSGALLAEEVDPLRLAYRGHLLGPRDGVPREAFMTAAPEQCEAIALQATLVGLLREMGWRPDRLDAARAVRLARLAGTFDEAARAGVADAFPELVPFVERLDRLREGWVALGAPNATRVSAQRQAEDQAWISGARAVPAAKAPPSGRDAKPAPALAATLAPATRSRIRSGLAIGLPALAIVVSMGYAVSVWRAADRVDPRVQAGAQEFVDLFDLERIQVIGDQLSAVAEDWDEIPEAERNDRVDSVCARAREVGFANVKIQDPAGRIVARCDTAAGGAR